MKKMRKGCFSVFIIALILFTSVLFKYTESVAGESSPCPITAEERQLLAKIVYLEARGESFEGKLAVLEVIKNRVQSGLFPASIVGVISQPRQFSSYPLLHLAKLDAECIRAVKSIFIDGVSILGKHVLFFCSPARMTSSELHRFEKTKTLVSRLGRHNFYALKKH